MLKKTIYVPQVHRILINDDLCCRLLILVLPSIRNVILFFEMLQSSYFIVAVSYFSNIKLHFKFEVLIVFVDLCRSFFISKQSFV